MKVIKRILSILGILVLVLLSLHILSSLWSKRLPKNGINESMHLDINRSKQWINIYGKGKSNPILLYLHGGPGPSTSETDYASIRKRADIYTVVTWDQRNCGKSYGQRQNKIGLIKEISLEDGKELTGFIRSHMGVDKVSILRYSWGSIYRANLVLEYPNYYNLFIGAGQLADTVENKKAFITEARKWGKNDEETQKFIEKIHPEEIMKNSIEAKNKILKKYEYNVMKDGMDYFIGTTLLFSPNYSITDWISFFQEDRQVYLSFFKTDEFKSFLLRGKYAYQVPYVNINDNMDYQANYELAEGYFHKLKSPQKDLYLIKNTSHGLMISKSSSFSDLLHGIYKNYE